MNNSTVLATLVRLRPALPIAIGVLLGLGLACDLGGEEGPCDTMCNEGLVGNVEEIAENDTLTCECGSKTPSQQACETYCDEVGGDPDTATVEGKSCVCSGLE